MTIARNILIYIIMACLAGPVPALAAGMGKLAIDTAAEEDVEFSVEIARTSREQIKGLQNRPSLAPDHGMLFLWDDAWRMQMWMKDTRMPLDMLFIGSDGKIMHIVSNTRPFSTTIIKPPRPAKAVLEIPGGTAQEKKIAPGDTVIHPAFGTEKK